MKYLLSHEGLPVLERFGADSKALIAFDFDGTLAPIVNEPPQARMPASIAQELEQLCAVAPVAILSGRNLRDLTQRVPQKVRWRIGNHGNEGLSAISVDKDSCFAICAEWTTQLQASPETRIEGISIEPKGYTLAVHYRLANNHLGAQEMLMRAFARLLPAPRVVHGKCVFDLIPPGAVCKDDAMRALVREARPDTVLYVGDDECDELVFNAAEPDWTTVRIGYWRHSAAKYYLRSQPEMRDLLKLLSLQLGLATHAAR